MIVITRNGTTRVYTGWRAWLIMGFALLLAWFILALIAIALVGVAATIGVMLFLLIPAAVIVALISSQMRRQAP